MNRYFELYDGTKTYYTPSGKQYTPEVMQASYAIVNSGIPIIIETDGTRNMLLGYDPLSVWRDRYNIDNVLTDEEAIVEIERVANLPQPKPGPTAEERMAAALEFQNILAMPLE